jgi:hypothetical protein
MINNIVDFIKLDKEGLPLLAENGLPFLVSAPITKSIPDLIVKGKTSHITEFAQLISDLEQWEWAKDYLAYMDEHNTITEFNENLEPEVDEEGNNLELRFKELPVEPIRPEVKTVEEVLAPYAVTLFKLSRQAEIDNSIVVVSTGKSFDADETSINRLANAIVKHLADPDDTIIRWSTADVSTGVMVDCTKAEIVEAHKLAVEFVDAVMEI